MEKIRVADGAASWRDFQAPFNDPTENEYLTPTQKKKLQMIKNPLGRGPQMNKNMKIDVKHVTRIEGHANIVENTQIGRAHV